MTLFVVCAAMATARIVSAVPEDVSRTKHNLSVSGRGPVRAVSEGEVCIFCHAPHNAAPQTPLWNHSPSAVGTYLTYETSTMDAAVGQPDGSSKLCLGCHDGTVAVGLTATRGSIAMTGLAMGGVLSPGESNLTTDLSDDHPISFIPDPGSDPETRLPPDGSPVLLDGNGKMQCSSCHNAHSFENPKFLVDNLENGELCLTCHVKTGWIGSAHEASAAFFPATGTGTTVSELSCMGCHDVHGAPGSERLLTSVMEEEVCYACHQPAPLGVAADIQSEALKPSGHSFDMVTGDHEPVTTFVPAEPVLLDRQHVECGDCHDPHRTRRDDPLEGARGIRLDGSVSKNLSGAPVEEYEICLRCHGDTFQQFMPPAPIRPPGASNKRREFSPGVGSFHPVAEVGRNRSIRLGTQLSRSGSGLTTSSRIKCTDCHNSEVTADTQGPASRSPSGPKGPHGSMHERLLRANYSTRIGTLNQAPFNVFNESNFELCFLCHDVRSLTAASDVTATNFGPDAKDLRNNLHALHLDGKTHASCHECHYNVHSTMGAINTDPPNAPHLINFAPNVRPVPPSAQPIWRPGGGDNGGAYCLLSCHGVEKTRGMDYLPGG